MRTLLPLGFALVAAGLAAQSPLVTNLTPANQGNTGGGLYFDLQVNTFVSITRIDTWVGQNGPSAGDLLLEVFACPTSYVGNLTNLAAWSPIGTAMATGYVPSPGNYQLYSFLCSAPIDLPAGDYGIALKSQSTPLPGLMPWNHAYSNGLTCTSSTAPGSCANSLHANAELTLRAGAAQNTFLTGPIFQPRVFSGAIHYVAAPAAAMPYGMGCGAPRLRLLPDPTAGAVIGTTARGLLSNCPSPVVLCGMGFSNTYCNGQPLPLSLAQYGAPGCDVLQSNDLGGWWMPTWYTGPGTAELRLAVPNLSGLVGVHVYVQAWGYGPGANAASFIVSNGLDWTILSQ